MSEYDVATPLPAAEWLTLDEAELDALDPAKFMRAPAKDEP